MPSETQTSGAFKKMIVAGWIISALPSLLMLGTGIMSLLNPAMMKEGMSKYGYPERAAVPIVITQLACVALYLIPRTSVLGAILLTGYLGGATATHVRAGEPFFMAVIVGVVFWLGLVLRDGRARGAILGGSR